VALRSDSAIVSEEGIFWMRRTGCVELILEQGLCEVQSGDGSLLANDVDSETIVFGMHNL
jgi:hypothetical protein